MLGSSLSSLAKNRQCTRSINNNTNKEEISTSYSTSLESTQNDSFHTPAPSIFTSTPALNSRAPSLTDIRPIPSISCKSNFSIQSFHTAAAGNTDLSDEQVDNIPAFISLSNDGRKCGETIGRQISTAPATTLKCYQNLSNMLSCASSSANTIPASAGDQEQDPRVITATNASGTSTDDQHSSSSSGDSASRHTQPNPELFVHPITLVQSNRSNSSWLPNSYLHYGSLDSHHQHVYSRSPAATTTNSYYLYDYMSEEYEVVLDDGTRQKRSVSLSTMPNTPMFDFSNNNNKRKYKANVNLSYFNLENDTESRRHQRFGSTATEDQATVSTNGYQNSYFDDERQALLMSNETNADPNLILRDLDQSSDDEDDNEEAVSDCNRDKRYKRHYHNKQHKRRNLKKTRYYYRLLTLITTPFKAFHHWLTETVFTYKRRMVVKCSIAYLLGSMFTFIPTFHNMLSPSSKLLSQIIATVTVFFSASKTVGGMVEAVLYGLAFTIFASLVSVMSMILAVYLRSRDHYVISSCVTLGFWLAGSTFLWSFLKAHYNKPTLATGCGLGSMIMFPVLVKEGSEIPEVFDPTYIEEMFILVTLGTFISAFVCWFMWPVTATGKLRSDINDTLAAVRVLLKLLTKTFLLDQDLPDFRANDNLQTAINSHRTSFTSLKSSLSDAKKEYYNFDIWTHADEYDDIVNSLQRLALHIGGLRSSCGLQFDVMKNNSSISQSSHSTKKSKLSDSKYGSMSNNEQQQQQQQALATNSNNNITKAGKNKIYHIVKATDQRKKMEYELKKEQTLSAISIASPTYGTGSIKIPSQHFSNDYQQQQQPVAERIPINGLNKSREDTAYYDENMDDDTEEGPLVQFIKTVRGPMKSLAFTCKQTIVHLQARFTGQSTAATPSFSLMRQTLAMAMSLFEESQQLALMRLYKRKMMRKCKEDTIQKQQRDEQTNAGGSSNASNNRINPRELQSHLMTQFPAEDVFLVYFFVFNLLEFAKELMCLVQCVQNLFEEDELSDKSYLQKLIRNYLFTPFWIVCCCFYGRKPSSTTSSTTHPSKQTDDVGDTYSSTPGVTVNLSSMQNYRSINRKVSIDSFIPNNNNTFNTLHTPKPKTRMRQIFLNLWGFFSWFRQHTVRYGLKSAFVVVLISSLAFIPSTREYFSSWKMDWTLITVMAVMTPTVGGTNEVAVLRVLATMLGSIIAVLVYTFLPQQGPLLLFTSWAFSVPCFWVIQNHKHGRFGLFSLLAYNLIVPFMYNHRNEEPVYDVQTLAFMRCATVSAGVIIGLIVTAYIWPFEARKELRKGLSDFLIRLSWLYKQLVTEYSEDNSHLVSVSSSMQVKATRDDSNNNSTTTTRYSELVKQTILETNDNNFSTSSTDDIKKEPSFTTTTAARQEFEALTKHKSLRSLQFQHMELALQVSLVELQGLLAYAPNEPRLKGPFPAKTYQAMLTSCQNILDKFLSIRIVILKDVWATQVRRDLMTPVRLELMEMAGCVLLYFYLLASALQLKTPLPPYLPPAEKARESLMMKLQQLPKITSMDGGSSAGCCHSSSNMNRAGNEGDDSYMVYYAYVIMMESIIIELDELGRRMKELFGTLIPDDQWARYFGTVDV